MDMGLVMEHGRLYDEYLMAARYEARYGTAKEKNTASKVQQTPISSRVNSLQFKQRGDVHVSNKDYILACDAYTQGLECDKPLARTLKMTLLSNRARAFLKRKMFIEAKKDATGALNIDANYERFKILFAIYFPESVTKLSKTWDGNSPKDIVDSWFKLHKNDDILTIFSDYNSEEQEEILDYSCSKSSSSDAIIIP